MRNSGCYWAKNDFVGAFVLSAVLVLGAGTAPAQTLKTVKERGTLICGIGSGLLGFAIVDSHGNWSGFDVDLCRGIAAAVFNDTARVSFVPLETQERFAALQAGKVDVLARNATWTMSRENTFGILFATVTYYDGQGFLVRRAKNVDSALELDGATVCVQSGTTTELNLADYFHSNKMNYKALGYPGASETVQAYSSGQCDVFTSDISQLYSEKLNLPKPDDHVILPEVISKEPLGPAVRQGDDQWFNIVKWTHFAMINAEELGVNSATIGEAMKSDKPDVKRLLGTDGNLGEQIGLSSDWALHIVKLVGNYSEVFERNMGVGSKLGIPRGLNSLWTNGGIQYAPPLR
jgi:general L-amino acid transport system substrate-binding protein